MSLRCTVIVSCYNKEQFIADAVDSALAQTYPFVDVIAIDDGSRDGSASVLKQYGTRITCVLKENGGMASPMNLGFSMARGDIIFFLDGDDVLLPETVARVVEIWRPNFSKVHFRLQKIKADGTPIAGAMLPPYRALASGDLRKMLNTFGFYPSPPTSGNAFSASYLKQVMPLAEKTFDRCAETPLVGMAPLFGDIGTLDGIGALWRSSDDNLSSGDLSLLESEVAICERFLELANTHSSGKNTGKSIPARWPFYLKRKVIIAKFDTNNPERSRIFPTILQYLYCIIRWPEYAILTRLKFVIWSIAILILPAGLLRTVPGIAGPGLRPTRATSS